MQTIRDQTAVTALYLDYRGQQINSVFVCVYTGVFVHIKCSAVQLRTISFQNKPADNGNVFKD